MADKIVYLEVSNGGGVDGRDHTDKGGRIMKASLTPLKPSAWGHIKKTVEDLDEVAKAALDKLTPVERLALDYWFSDATSR